MSSAPETGQMVTVRERPWIVTDVRGNALKGARQHLVDLVSIEDGAHGETLRVLWDIEPGAQANPESTLPGMAGFDTVAREFYSHVAPVKSQTDPLEHRTENARAWYRQQARDFLYRALYPNSPNLTGTPSGQVTPGAPHALNGQRDSQQTALGSSRNTVPNAALAGTPPLPLSAPTTGNQGEHPKPLQDTKVSRDTPVDPSVGKRSVSPTIMLLAAIVALLVILILIQVF